MQIGQKAALGLVIGVGNIVPVLGLLPGDLTYSSHDGLRSEKGAGL